MTLEDFFTLTEMKDGLTAFVRVQELVAVMKEKDGVVKNVGDTTRQWAAVASTIAATESKECLDLFIQLDGLLFIDKWLKDAQKFANEESACFVEEAISALLQAVEKLQIDNERLVSSGICTTVKGLLSHKSPKVQDKARALSNSWKLQNVDIKNMDVENSAASDDAKKHSELLKSELTANDTSLARITVGQMSNGSNDGENVKLTNDQESSHIDVVVSNDAIENSEHPKSEFIANYASLARIQVDQRPNGTDGECVQLTNDQESSRITSGDADMNDELPESVASPCKLNSAVNDPSAKKEEVLRLCDGNVDSQISTASKQVTGDVVLKKCDGEKPKDIKHGNLSGDSADKVEGSASWGGSDGRKILSGTDVTAVEEAVTCSDASKYDRCESALVKTSSSDDANPPLVNSTKEATVDDVGNSGVRSFEQRGMDQGIGSVSVETKNQGTTESIMKEICTEDEAKQLLTNKKKRVGKSSKFVKLTKNSRNTDLIRQTANMDIEDVSFDALEVARLVANAVEREVVNYEEHSGTSSSSSSSSSSSFDRFSAGGIKVLDSSKSIVVEQESEINSPINECLTMENVPPETSEKAPLKRLATTETHPENHLHDMKSSQLTDSVRDPQSNTENRFLEFDLNQEFSSEDLDQNQVDALNPVSVVSASRAVVAHGMLAGPLKFEGNHGWKGSAATSAFRPASPRRTFDSERPLSGGPTSSGSRQRQDFLDIDLNVASGDGKVGNHMSRGKEKQVIPVFPSGESSFELSSKQPERVKFDLNHTEEDGNGPVSHWQLGCPSPASSSCIQPPTRNFDLNDNPSNGNDHPSNIQPFPWGPSSNAKVNPYLGHQDDSVISIMGTKVEKSAFPSQTAAFPPQTSSFQNGRASESFIDGNLFKGGPFMGLGPGVPYPQSVYGYNGLAMGPPVSFSSTPVYAPVGSIPYMFDTRGSPFGPQIIGASPSVPSSYGQPSLMMNMMGPTPGPNVASPLHPSLDLNPGYPVDVGNRDPTFFRQLFIPGQGRQLDDQLLRDGFRPLSSGSSSGKRKEPETGWELFPNNYKHHQPPRL